MKKDALRGAEKYTKEHQRKKRWYRVVTCLACVVVFCTVYALILPAITLEKGACEIPEHTHSEACYTQVTSTRTEPVCTIESLNLHQHDDTCYDSEGNLTCGYADFVVHRHDATCYDEDGNLWCPLPEIETHEHTDSCYSVPETGEPELICDKTEVILHEHTSDCFDEDGNLICGKIQVLEHQHTDACFETVEEPVDADTLTCTLPEDENHTHGPLCYGNWELTCGMEEHTHSEECQGTEEALEQGNLNMILPEGAQIPDGYDANYSYIDPDNRFGVTVYASEGALPDNAVLSAELLEQGSEAYEAAQQALTDTVYDGFAALDIHFTVDGEEIEPESSVYVCINVMGLLPEDADADTLAVQHHEQSGAALLTPDEEESLALAGAATVETVADAAKETGQVEALDNGTETAADVAAAFEVESFSTFTITWRDNSNYVLNLHYVDTAGNSIAPSDTEKKFETVNNTANVTMSNYADEIDHPGYVYQYAYIDNGGTKTAVNKLSYNSHSHNLPQWHFTTETATDDWTVWTGSENKTSMDVYLVYQEINTDGTVKVTWQGGEYALYLHYVDTAGNPLQIDTSKTYVDSVAGVGNIIVSDYAGLVYPPASYQYQKAYIEVNNAQTEVARISYNDHWCITTPGSDQWLSWPDSETEVYNETQAHVYLSYTKKTDAYYYAQPIHDNIKLTLYDYGSYINTGNDKVIPFYQASGGHSSIDGYQPVELITNNRARPPKMEPKLNDAGYPQVSSEWDSLPHEATSLEYLFRKGGLPLNTGNADSPLTKYADMRNNATWSQRAGYRTQFESMRFDLGGDGGLFHVDENGYYIYDCENQSAYYNQDTNRFELSNTLIDVGHNSGTYKNFLPFDKINPALGGSFTADGTIYKLPHSTTEDKRSGIADLWFGMTMQVDFYMPSSGKVNGKDMVFDFRGDDDVWVYIDNVLVLDMGGCHAARRGSINFATGEVVYPDPVADNGQTTINTTLKDLFTKAGASTASFGNSNTFIDWTEHTLKFYYMERGGNISSCRLKFNLPTRPDKALQVAKTLTANKEADTDVVKHLENTMEYKYRVVKADANDNPTDELLIKEGDSYTITGTGLTANEPQTVGTDGYFTLKAGQMAEFTNMLARFEQTDSVKKYVVQEVMPTGLTGQYQEVVYNVSGGTGTIKAETTQVETNFTGYNSPAQSAEVGNLVSYTNKVDTEQLSTLEITKTQVGSSLNDPECYYMKVQLGPDAEHLAPISVGTTYYVGDTGRTRSVEQAGIIKLKAGETVKVKLLAGTHYKVEEVANENGRELTGNEGYTPAYSNASGTVSSGSTSGTVTQVFSKVNITVTNTFPTGDLELTKIVNNTAGGSTDGEFAFELKFEVGDNWKNTNYTAAYTTTDSGQTHTGDTLSFTKRDGCAVATVSLYNNETVTVKGLPKDAQVTITEVNSDGYSVGWEVNNNQESYGKTVTCPITASDDGIATATVICTNTTGYELPDTGGTGTKPYTTGGFLLLTVAAILLLYIHTKHRKEGTISS